MNGKTKMTEVCKKHIATEFLNYAS